MNHLFTPWRHPFVSAKSTDSGCFLCAAADDPDDPERLVVFRARHHVVLLNRFPYTNGHLLVAPLEHQSDPALASAAARRELWDLVLEARRAIEATYHPDGMNLGMNLGTAGGGGLPDHYHFHVVPRWDGDTSFVSVVGGVRLVPEALETTWHKLRDAFSELG